MIFRRKGSEARKGPSAYIQMGLPAWGRTLFRHRFNVAPGAILPALYMTLSGPIYSFVGALQNLSFRGASAESSIREPIFIIGHWRSGTTFLHELLCSDPNHHYPSTYACMNPHHFLLTKEWIAKLEHSKGAVQRPMDNMVISMESPQEDEFALLALGAPSIYEALLFPKGVMKCLEDYAAPASLSAKELKRWERSFRLFAREISIGESGRLVLKSPTHTYKVDLLQRLYPDARFIHIVRNPYTVFASCLKLWDKLFGIYGFNRVSREAIEAFVLDAWVRMEDCLDRARDSLNPENYMRLKYEDLVADAEREATRVYEFLGYGGIEAVRPRLRSFLASRNDYRPNRHVLAPEQVERISSAWAHIFARYGYPVDDCPLRVADNGPRAADYESGSS